MWHERLHSTGLNSCGSFFGRYLQFTIRVGSHSTTNTCPSPDMSHDRSGEVLLIYSCNAGTTWELLKQFDSIGYREPRYSVWNGCIYMFILNDKDGDFYLCSFLLNIKWWKHIAEYISFIFVKLVSSWWCIKMSNGSKFKTKKNRS